MLNYFISSQVQFHNTSFTFTSLTFLFQLLYPSQSLFCLLDDVIQTAPRMLPVQPRLHCDVCAEALSPVLDDVSDNTVFIAF